MIIKKLISNHINKFLDCRNLSAKGVSKAAQKMLSHQRYRDTLTSGSLFKTENSRIASESHNLQTVTSTKTSLSAFDDKRYILDDGQQTLPYGHKNIVGQTVIGIDDSDDNTAAVNSDPTDNDDLQKWMPFFEDRQQPVSWDCDDFLGCLKNSLTLKTLIGTIRKLMMNTLRIVLLLRTHNHIARFDN